MDLTTNYNGKTALVVGAGRSGLSAARFLLNGGAHVILSDSRDRTALDASISGLDESAGVTGALELELGGHRPESFERCDFAVVSPGVPLTLPEFEMCRKAGIPIMAESPGCLRAGNWRVRRRKCLQAWNRRQDRSKVSRCFRPRIPACRHP